MALIKGTQDLRGHRYTLTHWHTHTRTQTCMQQVCDNKSRQKQDFFFFCINTHTRLQNVSAGNKLQFINLSLFLENIIQRLLLVGEFVITSSSSQVKREWPFVSPLTNDNYLTQQSMANRLLWERDLRAVNALNGQDVRVIWSHFTQCLNECTTCVEYYSVTLVLLPFACIYVGFITNNLAFYYKNQFPDEDNKKRKPLRYQKVNKDSV